MCLHLKNLYHIAYLMGLKGMNRALEQLYIVVSAFKRV